MITQILDGGKFEDIKATRIHKIIDGGGDEEVAIKDLTKDELMDIARTYYCALQELTELLRIAVGQMKAGIKSGSKKNKRRKANGKIKKS